MQIPGSMYFGEMCECNNFQCGVDTRGRLCSGEEEMLAGHILFMHAVLWAIITNVGDTVLGLLI